jgi:cytochrome c-type biogenesis protein CcmF
MIAAVGVAALAGVPLLLAVLVGVAAFAVVAFAAAFVFDVARHPRKGVVVRAVGALAVRRSMYAGFLIHLGLVGLGLGIAASSLGTTQQDVSLAHGETIEWNERQVQFVAQHERELPDKMVIEAELVVASGAQSATLLPARHFHRLAGVWTTEVDIDATLWSDVYVILHGADSRGRVRLTLIENPLVTWIWIGGGVMAVGAVVRLWPRRRSRAHARASLRRATWKTAACVSPPTKRAA